MFERYDDNDAKLLNVCQVYVKHIPYPHWFELQQKYNLIKLDSDRNRLIAVR